MGNTNTSLFPVNILTQSKVNKCNSYTSPLIHIFIEQQQHISTNSFRFIEVIGTGGFGKVNIYIYIHIYIINRYGKPFI